MTRKPTQGDSNVHYKRLYHRSRSSPVPTTSSEGDLLTIESTDRILRDSVYAPLGPPTSSEQATRQSFPFLPCRSSSSSLLNRLLNLSLFLRLIQILSSHRSNLISLPIHNSQIDQFSLHRLALIFPLWVCRLITRLENVYLNPQPDCIYLSTQTQKSPSHHVF